MGTPEFRQAYFELYPQFVERNSLSLEQGGFIYELDSILDRDTDKILATRKRVSHFRGLSTDPIAIDGALVWTSESSKKLSGTLRNDLLKPGCTCQACTAVRTTDPVLDPDSKFCHRAMEMITIMRRLLVMWFPQDFASTTPSFYEMWGVLVAKSGAFDWVEAVMDVQDPGEKEMEVCKLFNIVRGEREKFLERMTKSRLAWLKQVGDGLVRAGIIPKEKDGKDTEEAESIKKDENSEDHEKDKKAEDADIDEAEEAVQNLKV